LTALCLRASAHDWSAIRTEDAAEHWDDVYLSGVTARSWFQVVPAFSLKMLHAAGFGHRDSVIDVGGGASTLIEALLDREHADVTVLDISATALRLAQERLGARASQVTWVVADVLTWRAERRYQVWHDRAVFHFLTTHDDRRRYVAAMNAATGPRSVAVFGCFAPDGPSSCSGLPTARYDPQALAAVLGADWVPVAGEREEHITPNNVVQPFTWAAFRRQR
jgi:SAM-dependent methyltransferase